jgi:CheY-like chemotaxis protein
MNNHQIAWHRILHFFILSVSETISIGATVCFLMPYNKLLLIDDDEDDQEIFMSATSSISQEIRCVAISDATKALHGLSAQELDPDIIFLDLNMPVMNGQQFLTEIKKREKLKDIPVIIFSTSSQPRTIEAMKRLGAHDFITKPGLFDELVSILTPILTH